MSAQDRAEFLRQPHVGVIATLRGDGRPYTVPVWWLYDESEDVVWLTGTSSRVWCRQLMKDGRTSLCIEAGAPLSGHVEVDGLAEVLAPPDFDIWPISRLLA
jgi:general stress protein 26